MSQPAEAQIQSLLEIAERRERRARRRAVIYSLVPVGLAFLLFLFAFWTVRRAEVRVKEAEGEAARLRGEIKALEAKIGDLSRGLRRVTDFDRYRFQGDIALTRKRLDRRRGELFVDILTRQREGARWMPGGTSPAEGFDSPGFVAYLLDKYGLLNGSPQTAHYRLREVLPFTPLREMPSAEALRSSPPERRHGQPQPGDVIFYEGGYTMFYFEDERRRPFVVGMTPEGIFAVRADFVPVLGYGRVDYPDD